MNALVKVTIGFHHALKQNVIVTPCINTLSLGIEPEPEKFLARLVYSLVCSLLYSGNLDAGLLQVCVGVVFNMHELRMQIHSHD